MKKIIITIIFSGAVLACIFLWNARATEGAGEFQKFEYATIRWGGRENTQLIRPSGKTELLAPLLNKAPRPDRVDERAFFMNISMNAIAKEGYELAGMTGDEIVMKRPVPRQ